MFHVIVNVIWCNTYWMKTDPDMCLIPNCFYKNCPDFNWNKMSRFVSRVMLLVYIDISATESDNQGFLGGLFNANWNFEAYIRNICNFAKRQLNALSRIVKLIFPYHLFPNLNVFLLNIYYLLRKWVGALSK